MNRRPILICAACIAIVFTIFFFSLDYYLHTPGAIEGALQRIHEGP